MSDPPSRPDAASRAGLSLDVWAVLTALALAALAATNVLPAISW